MNTEAAEVFVPEYQSAEHRPSSDAEEILEQLARILSSSYFRYSRKYPAFLRYIVEKALNNEADGLKERSIGIEVFGRDANYLTNDDPVVRVTAGEVRKRLAQYYQTAHSAGPFTIHLPVGSYVPQFFRAEPRPAPDLLSQEVRNLVPRPEPDGSDPPAPHIELPAPPLPAPPVRVKLRTSVLIASALALLLFAGRFGEHLLMGGRGARPAATDVLDVLWQPLIETPRAVLIYAQEMDLIDGLGSDQMNALNGNDHFRRMRLIPTATMTEIAAASGYLMMHHKPFNVQPSSRITFYDLQSGPFVVFGEPDDPWVHRLTDNLRFHVVRDDGEVLRIADRENPGLHQWALDTKLSYANQTKDYAIVSRLHDPNTNENVIVATGLGERGLFAAGRFLRTSEYARPLVHDASTSWTGRPNIEIVISATVLDGVIGPPHVEASCFW